MSKKQSEKDSLPVSNEREVRTSEEDVIILDVSDSSPDDFFPDISVTKKTPSHLHNSNVNCRPSSSTAVGFEKGIGNGPAGVNAAMHRHTTQKRDLAPKTGGLAETANQSILGASQKHHLASSTPPADKRKPVAPNRTPGTLGSPPERNMQLAGHSNSARKACKTREPPAHAMDQHSGRFLDCMDLFTPSPAGRPGERHKQASITPKPGVGKAKLGKRHDILCNSGTLVRAKIGEKRHRKHSHEFDGGRNVHPSSGKTARLTLGEKSSSFPTMTAHKEKPAQCSSKGMSKEELTPAIRERPSSLGKHASHSKGSLQKTASDAGSMPPASSGASKPVSQAQTSPRPFTETAPKHLKHSQNALPQSKKARTPSFSSTESITPSSPPPKRRSSVPKIITLQHFQQKYSDASGDSGPSGIPGINKDSETETSSSMFDFNENDLFEVLDSVESESICSAYNQSDSESVGVTNDNKPSPESPQPSKLATTHTPKSPSESRIHDFKQSFVKRKIMKPQVAKKSTTLNGKKHPVRGRGRIHMTGYCTVRLTHIKNSVVQKARKDFTKYVKSKKLASDSAQVRSTKKRENKLNNSSSNSSAKRIKLSSDSPASQPAAAADPSTSSLLKQPASVLPTAQSNTPVQITPTEQSQEKVIQQKASKKDVQVASQQHAPQTQAEKQGRGEENIKEDDVVLSPLRTAPSPAISSCRPLPLILRRHQNHSLSIQASGEGLTNSIPSTSCVPDLSCKASSVSQKKRENKTVLGARETKSHEKGSTSEPVTPVSKCLFLNRKKPDQKRSASEQPPDKPSEESNSLDDVVPVRFSSQPPAPEHGVWQEDKTVACLPVSKLPLQQHSHVSDPSETVVMENEAQTNAVNEEHAVQMTPAQMEKGSSVPADAEDMEPIASTSHLLQDDKDTQTEKPKKSAKQNSGLGKLSQRDEAYDLRLMETIAKLAPAPSSNITAASKNRNLSSTKVDDVEGSGGEVEERPSLTVKFPISQLSRTPVTSPVVITRPLGMFRDASVQADRGMIIDKDVLDNYLVVKLSEAMFDMKAQLQMMEAQVASIAKQKDSLERTLQAKTQYIRDMTTTGFKPAMVDKSTLTDPTPLSPEQRHPQTQSESSSPVRQKPKSRKNITTHERGVQTRPKVSNVSCQTEGFLRSVPPRLKLSSQPVCLYNHPESELQLYIEDKESVVHPSHDSRKEAVAPLAGQGHKWLLVDEGCSRTKGVNPKVRFMRAIENSSRTRRCAQCSGIRVGSKEAEATTSNVNVCNCSNTEASSESSSANNKAARDLTRVCLSPPLHAAVSKLSELYFKLKALPKEPVQERHMECVLEAVRHLLSHLPIEFKSPASSSLVTTSPKSTTDTPSTQTTEHTPTTPVPCTPPPAEPPSSSSPSTPGAASWAMGAKMQGLVDVLQELDDRGKEVLPTYFRAELVQLQKKTRETLAFLTVGLRHETFSHEKSGCIVASDIHLRPWRDRDLQVNPFFHRLFLDVGIRGLLNEVKRLTKQNRKGRRLGKESSEEDSDLELLCSPPTSPKQQVRPQAAVGSSRVRKRKGTGKTFKKTPTSKGERIRQLGMEKQSKKNKQNFTIPAPTVTSGSYAPSSSLPTDSCGVVPHANTSVTSTSSREAASASASVVLLAATSLPMSSTAVVPSTSPPRLTPYNKLITKGESFQVRLGELQSSVKTSHQPPVVSSQCGPTVASSTLETDLSNPCSFDTVTGNESSQLTVGQRMQQITQRLGVHQTSTPPSTQETNPVVASSNNSSTASTLPSTSSSAAPINPSAAALQHISASTPIPALPRTQMSLPRMALYNALETLACVLQRIQMTHSEKEALYKLIARALSLSRSTYAIDLHMAQLLVNQITQQLHMRSPTLFSGGSTSVFAKQVSPFMTYTYPTRSTFSASPNIVTTLALPAIPPNTAASNSLLQTRSASIGQSAVSIQVVTNPVVVSSMPNNQSFPQPAPILSHTTNRLSHPSNSMVSLPSVAKPAGPQVAPNIPVVTTVVNSNATTSVQTIATVQTTQGPTAATSKTAKATLSTTTSTTAACGDVRMSPGVAAAAVLATKPAQIQKSVSRELAGPIQVYNPVSTAPSHFHKLLSAKQPTNPTPQIQKHISALPATTASTTTTLKVAPHCPRVLWSVEHSTSLVNSSQNDGAAWQGISDLRTATIQKSLPNDASKDGKVKDSSATSSVGNVNTIPSIAGPAGSSCSLPTSTAVVATSIPLTAGLPSSSSVVIASKLPATALSLPPSIPTTSATVTAATVASSVRNPVLSASSIIGVLKEITPLLSYIGNPAATVSGVSIAITSSSVAPKTSTATTVPCTVASTATGDAAPLPASSSAATNTSKTSTKATFPCVSSSTIATHCTASTFTAAAVALNTSTTSTKTVASTTTSSLCTASTAAENRLADSTPSSGKTTFADNTPISTSTQISNTSASTCTLLASSTTTSSKATTTQPLASCAKFSQSSAIPGSLGRVQTSSTSDSPRTIITATTTFPSCAKLSQPQAIPSSCGQTSPMQAPIRPRGTTLNAAPSSVSSASLPPSIPPSVVHVPSISSLHHLSPHNLPVVTLQANKVFTGLVIKWTFSPQDISWQNFVERYDLYAFVSNKTSKIPDVSLWGKVGEIKPLALPMAVTLTNFAIGQRYAFAVRVRYVGGITSRYSNPCTIDL